MPNELFPPTEALKERTLRAARTTPSPVRSQRRWRDVGLMTAGLLITVAMFLAMGTVRPTGRPTALLIETSLSAALIAVAAMSAILGPGDRMLGPPRGVLLLGALTAPLSFLSWKLAWSLHAGMMDPWPTRPAYRCLLLIFFLALPPLLSMVFLRRNSDPIHPSAHGAALGVVFGMCAVVLGDLWCPVGHVPHLLVGHILPVALLGLVGAWPLARVLAMPAPESLDRRGQSAVLPRCPS
jgi:hypothetical protein